MKQTGWLFFSTNTATCTHWWTSLQMFLIVQPSLSLTCSCSCVYHLPCLPFFHIHSSCVFSKAAQTVRMMLKVAKNVVPRLEWKRTPVLLRATAGLRLLPAGKAQALLDQVKHRNSKGVRREPWELLDEALSGTFKGEASLLLQTGTFSDLRRQAVSLVWKGLVGGD